MEEKEIIPELGGRYLLRSLYTEGDLIEVTIWEITDKSICIRYGGTGIKKWLTKEAFAKHIIHEQLNPELTIQDALKAFEWNPLK